MAHNDEGISLLWFLTTLRDWLKGSQTTWALAAFAVVIAIFRIGLSRSRVALTLGPDLPYAFGSFTLLLAPLWFFGFGVGEWIGNFVRAPLLRVLLPGLLIIPYLVFAWPTHDFHVQALALMLALPIALGALLEYSRSPLSLTWQHIVVLTVLAITYMLHGLARAWPYAGLAVLPKLFVADVTLYLYLVIRKLDGIGYSLVPKLRAILVGIREWLLFAPLGIGLGTALKFIHFHPRVPSAMSAGTAVVVTFLLVAVPEEIFFRGVLQSLLETRLGRTTALLAASILFGLAHFNKGAIFNWRYVWLAAIAGIFYGRAWRADRQLLASIVTHTAVDVVWSLWFK
jgi:CAAX protease family protein